MPFVAPNATQYNPLLVKLVRVSLGIHATYLVVAVLAWAFKTARPMFKQRGEVYGNVTGRLTEGFSGIRIVKAYTAEEHEEKVFAEGARKLLSLIVGTMRTISTAVSTVDR